MTVIQLNFSTDASKDKDSILQALYTERIRLSNLQVINGRYKEIVQALDQFITVVDEYIKSNSSNSWLGFFKKLYYSYKVTNAAVELYNKYKSFSNE